MIDNRHQALGQVISYGLFFLSASALSLLAYYGLCTTIFMTAPILWLLTGPFALLLAACLLLWLASSSNFFYKSNYLSYKNKMLFLELFVLGAIIISSALGVYFFSSSSLGLLFLCGPALALIFSLLAITACIYFRTLSQKTDQLKINSVMQLPTIKFTAPATQFNRVVIPLQLSSQNSLTPREKGANSMLPSVPITPTKTTAIQQSPYVLQENESSTAGKRKITIEEVNQAITNKISIDLSKLSLEEKIIAFISAFKSLTEYSEAYAAFQDACNQQLQAKGSVILPATPLKSPSASVCSPADASPPSSSPKIEALSPNPNLTCHDCQTMNITTQASALRGITHLKSHADNSLLAFSRKWEFELEKSAVSPASSFNPLTSPPPPNSFQTPSKNFLQTPTTSPFDPLKSPDCPNRILSFSSLSPFVASLQRINTRD